MSTAVLDASAVLAYLRNEPGSEVVGSLLPGATISAVNLAEVISKLSDRGIAAATYRHALGALGLRVAQFSEESAYAVGALRDLTRSAGLSLGDRACLALAKALNLPAITADKAWGKLEFVVEVRVIR